MTVALNPEAERPAPTRALCRYDRLFIGGEWAAPLDIDRALNVAASSACSVSGQSWGFGSCVLAECATMIRVGMLPDEVTHTGQQVHVERLEKTLSYIDVLETRAVVVSATGQFPDAYAQ